MLLEYGPSPTHIRYRHKATLARADLLTRAGIGVFSALAALCHASPARAQSSQWGGVVALGSQLVDRGMAITSAGPILQGAGTWSSPSGWSAGVSASAQLRTPRRIVETLGQLGYSWSLSGDWQMQANALYYHYPRHGRSRTYDRTEVGVSWIYRDVLTFGLSATHLDDYGGQRPRGAADLGLRWPLAWHLSFTASAGVAQELVPPRGTNYDRDNHYYYGHVGLTWSQGPWRVDLAHIESSREPLYTQPDVSPWVATVSWAF
jgi:uncharacterized protein (TIGR02001 family)